MSIFVGSSEVQEIFVGGTRVQEVYQGANMVWEYVVTTALSSATSHVASTGVGDSWSSPGAARDGNYGTRAEYSSTLSSGTSTGNLKLYFAPISASEILEVRLSAKGSGSDSVTSYIYAGPANDSTSAPGTASVNFTEVSSPATYDSGLRTSNDAGTDTGISWDFDAADFLGSSAAVLDWWAGGASWVFVTKDYNFGGQGGELYEVQVQVKYKPV